MAKVAPAPASLTLAPANLTVPPPPPLSTPTVPEIHIEEDPDDQLSSLPSRASSRVPSAHHLRAPTRRESALERFTKTAKFVRKWSNKKEVDDTTHAAEFMKRLSVVAPPVDTHSVASGDQSIAASQAEDGGTTRKQTNRFLCCKKLKKSLKRRLRRFYFDPMNVVVYRWLTVISIAILYNAFVIIARQTFTQLQDTTWKVAVWFVFDYLADMVYIVDMTIQCRTSFIEQGLLVSNWKKMIIHYLKSRAFILDALSLLPFDLLYLIPAVGVSHPIVRLNRLLRVHRIMQFFYQAESRTNFPNALRIFNLMMYISLSIHWNACFYFLISKGIGFGSDDWVYPNITEPGFDTIGRQYLFSLYWSTLTLTTIGEVPGPVIEVEYLFVIFDFLVGVLIFATIVGMMGGIITNMNVRRTEFQGRLDNIKQYMRYRNVDKTLQGRVIKWFNYLWTNNQSLDEETILETLPKKLHAEIAIFVHLEMLSRVKIFESCEPNFLEELVLKLTPQVYSPGDCICRKGDIGKEMYIIKKGKLEVVTDDGKVVATLTEGSYFGEISILNVGTGGNRRTATVRSVGYSDLFCLSKADLLEVLEEYPEAKADLEKRANDTLKRYGNDEEDDKEGESSSINNENIATLQKRLDDSEQKMEQLRGKLNRLQNEYNSFQAKMKQRLTALEQQSQHKKRTSTQL